MGGTKSRLSVHDLLNIKQLGRRKALRLGMVHYHLKPGGVASVMRDIASALREYSRYESVEIDVLASFEKEGNAREIFEFPRNSAVPTKLRICNIPSLAYRNKPHPDRASFFAAADDLASEILQQINLSTSEPDFPYILHSHNISLGKNPAATMAFKRLAEIAAAKALPLWLVNHVHDFAENNRPEQMSAFNTCTGRLDEAFARSFMYPSGRNIIYLTINNADVENLLTLGIPRDRIFLLPDPIDVSQFEQKPLWDGREFATLGLPPADYKAILLKRLEEYAAKIKQHFDARLPILLSPMKVMRRKNNAESLLLLLLFRRLGRDYQLLITLDANSPPDVAYSQQMNRFATSRAIPLLVGFGREIISGTGHRVIHDGAVKQFGMGDLHGLSEALLTTSIMEGFGLVYHEGWLSGKMVIGRKISEIVRDFEDNGMRFDHMYEKLAISRADLPNLRERLFHAYVKQFCKNGSGTLPHSEINDIVEAKQFRVGNEDCIDFADLGIEMQEELLDRVSDEPALAERLVERNPKVNEMFRLLQNRRSDLIETNRAIVRSKYSLQAMARRLENLFEYGDSIYRRESISIPLSAERHAALVERYRRPEKVRLLS